MRRTRTRKNTKKHAEKQDRGQNAHTTMNTKVEGLHQLANCLNDPRRTWARLREFISPAVLRLFKSRGKGANSTAVQQAGPLKARLAKSAHQGSFNLARWYAIASLCFIAVFSAASATILLRFLDNHLLERDAAVSMEFIQLIAQVDGASEYFLQPAEPGTDQRLAQFFNRVGAMPDVIRANVYASDGSVLWSSDSSVYSHVQGSNDELDRALTGKLTYEYVDRESEDKSEHAGLPMKFGRFVENYLPISDRSGTSVLGVVELYKLPTALLRALDQGRLLIWTLAGSGALLLYLSLFWIVKRGQSVIHRQHERLVNAESMAAVGELSSVVAHSLRNPLASIRSSAELCLELEGDARATRESTEDIIRESDRLSQWIRELLHLSGLGHNALVPVEIDTIAQSSLDGFARSLRGRPIHCELRVDQPLPRIRGDEPLLSHLFNSLIANALEAMGDRGRLCIDMQYRSREGCVHVVVSDTGPGLSEQDSKRIFEPFFTSKSTGLGLGLAMVRRIVERHGGQIELLSRTGEGTTFAIKFPL